MHAAEAEPRARAAGGEMRAPAGGGEITLALLVYTFYLKNKIYFFKYSLISVTVLTSVI